MITAQIEHKSRWRGRYWRRVELELVEGGEAVVLDGGSPKTLVRISDEGSDVVRIEIADVTAYEAARQACVLPKTETLRLRGAGLFEALDAHRRRRSTAVPPPEPPAARPPAESGPPLPPAPGTNAADAAPTVGALEARLTKLQRSDLEQRLAALNPATAGAAPPVDALRARLAALRDGDATGPAFVDRAKGFLDAASDDDEDAIVARAREAARLDGRACSDDGLLECLAGLDDDEERGAAATVDDDVESLLREARQLGSTARADLAAADLPTKGNDVADLLSQAGDLVARAARDRGGGVGPSVGDVPDYDDDSANDEPTDSSSEDEDDDR